MSASSEKPRFAAIPALFFAVGLGMMFYYGDLCYQLPVYSQAEIEQSVELNLVLDLRQRDTALVADPAQLTQRRADIRSSLLTEIQQEQWQAQRGIGIGLILLAMGLGQMFVLRRYATR